MNPGDDNRRGGGATRMNSQDRKFKTVLDGIEDVDVKFKNKIVTAFQEKAQVKMARIEALRHLLYFHLLYGHLL